jgi:hypothetical protein
MNIRVVKWKNEEAWSIALYGAPIQTHIPGSRQRGPSYPSCYGYWCERKSRFAVEHCADKFDAREKAADYKVANWQTLVDAIALAL